MKKFINLAMAAVMIVSMSVGVVAFKPTENAGAASCKSYVYKKGGYGECVRNIQKILNGHAAAFGRSWGCTKPQYPGYISADASFGPLTYNRVRSFQTQSCIKSDGIVGAQTWAELCMYARSIEWNWPSTTNSYMKSAITAGYNSGCSMMRN